MKQILLLLLALLPSIIEAQVKKTVHVGTDTDLETLLGDNKLEIDTLVITGELRHRDFPVLRECAYTGKLRSLYMDGCTVENDSLPENALMMLGLGGALDSITLPKQLRAIGDFAFYLNDIRAIDLPPTLRYIGACAFQQCYWLHDIKIPEGVEVIGTNCFRECDALEELNLPSTIKELGLGIVAITQNLKTVHIAEGIKKIDPRAFWESGVLEEITIPESVEIIGYAAFWCCQFLRHVALPGGLTDINTSTFEECYALNDVVWPKELKIIHDRAFAKCGFTTLTLPDGLTHVCNNAFTENRELTRVVLPESLAELGYMAFGGCDQLREVYSASPVPPAIADVSTNGEGVYSNTIDIKSPFGDAAQKAVLYVPIGAKTAYEAAQYWQDFGEIRETADFPTAIAAPTATQLRCKVAGGRGQIVIIPTGGAADYAIYSADGRLVEKGRTAKETVVEAATGMYIADTNGAKTKVMVK